MHSSLDIEHADQLVAYLRSAGRIGADETPRVTNLAGGVSNRTVLLERPNGEAWVLKQALERLRVRVDWRSDPRRIEREALGMQTLLKIALPGAITPLIFLDAAHHLLAMRAVPKPHENWKNVLLAGRVEAGHVNQFSALLAAIHLAGDQERQTLADEFADQSYFESLRLEPYYLYTAQRMPAISPFIEKLVEETRATRYTLVHGDFSPKNVLVHQDNLILLDHEVIHFGDGAFDLGFALTHFLSKANFLRSRRGDFSKAAQSFWVGYWRAVSAAPWAQDLESRVCRHTLACLLARCIGRSPLEYLDPGQAATQANIVSRMMHDPPAQVIDLVHDFVQRLGK
jgi:aminoglycoside phosphotransferase (APT) family kinase protein